jgi:DNA-binding NarL/FixJ family response regulator
MLKEKNEDCAPALIVAHPGRIRDGLRTLLRATPRIETVFQADDGPSALKIITEHHPALVLLDSKLANNDIQSVARYIKTESPQTRCIILVDHARQQWMAKVADADSVLPIGCPAGEFFATVEGVLACSGGRKANGKKGLNETI